MPAPIRRGFTLVELLVVVSLIGVLISLLLPAIMAARESARRATCQSHLKQLATAVALHHGAHGHFPTDGWGYQWAGDPDRGYDMWQPGGWIFNLLAYLEQAALRDAPIGVAGTPRSTATAELLSTPLAIFHCPTRRRAGLYPYTERRFPLRNSDPLDFAAKTDYAICAGHFNIPAYPGPSSMGAVDLEGYVWPEFPQMTGISFVLSTTREEDVTDGLSSTCLIGEKYLSVAEYHSGTSLGDDQSMFIGDDADIRRWTSMPPVPDASRIDDIEHFGGPHAGGCYFVFCDGSIHFVSFSIDSNLFRRLGHRGDGAAASF